MNSPSNLEKAFKTAKDIYAELGVDCEKALSALEGLSISLHCWQGDDVGGFEKLGAGLTGGGIQVTGSYPGKARSVSELQMDLKKAFSLIPGRHRLNLHAIYGEFNGKSIDRDSIQEGHYKGWVDWIASEGLKLDFNCTCFSHPKADGGFTLTSPDKKIRSFWIEHIKRCRRISEWIGGQQKSTCIHNLWVPDGSKDLVTNRFERRKLLKESLDEIYETVYSPDKMKDSIESKLFGIGSEAFVAGSHDFYLGYALLNKKMICLDLGHFHPTESVADKISSIMQFTDELLIHVSRGVRWDSDHVVILQDDLYRLAEEIVRCGVLDRVNIATDFFDGSINRIGAWVIGARAILKAFLHALLEPLDQLRESESSGDLFSRLALMEENKSLPLGAVWDYFCLKNDVPSGRSWIEDVRKYEASVTSKRS